VREKGDGDTEFATIQYSRKALFGNKVKEGGSDTAGGRE
jgi:hypothetical protein